MIKQTDQIMSEKSKKPEKETTKFIQVKDFGKAVDSVSILKFDTKMLDNIGSGSCIITSTNISGNQIPERVAVCKEGNTIKIFKIIERPK